MVLGVELRAFLLRKFIELRFLQKFIHLLIKRMARPLHYLIVADPYLFLPLSPPSRPHRHRSFSPECIRILRETITNTSYIRLHINSSDFRHRLLEAMASMAFRTAIP